MRLNRGRFSRQEYNVGDRVPIQDPKTKTWHVTGTITGARCHEGGNRPVSYLIHDDAEAELLRNRKFLRLRRKQGSWAASSESSMAGSERRVTFQGTKEIGGTSKTAGGDLSEKKNSETTNNGVVDNSYSLVNIHVSLVTSLSLGC